jgi:hypothetical protein
MQKKGSGAQHTALRMPPPAAVSLPHGRPARRCTSSVHLACSSVSAAVAQRGRDAVQLIGRATWHETEAEVCEHSLTHLVLGTNTRSVKCMLAAAAGAQIVSPAWLELCWKKRTWLPAGVYAAKVHAPDLWMCL